MKKITRISQAVKKENNVNIELDGEFWVNISKDLLLKLRLEKGTRLDEQQIAHVEKYTVIDKNIDYVYNLLQRRPYSISEVRTYLARRRGLDQQQIEMVIDKLVNRKALDDKSFTRWFVAVRFRRGNHGGSKIKSELLGKGINTKLATEVIKEYLQVEENQNQHMNDLVEYAKKLQVRISEEDPYKKKFKLKQRLLSRGYSYSEIVEAFKQVGI